MSEEAKAKELEKARERMEKVASEKSHAEAEFYNIAQKHKMRERRKNRSGKEHLIDNLQAKIGMQMLKSEGRMVEFSRRSEGKKSEITDWKTYRNRGESFEHELRNKRPDIVEILNEKAREEKEKERAREERVKEDGGEWVHDGENGYFWSGEGEPPSENDSFENEVLTQEKLKELRKEEQEQDEAIKKFRNEENKKLRRLKEEERRKSMSIPLDPLPERDLCEYEKIRENNISEREKAMYESGFFEDLLSYKREIGLVNVENVDLSAKVSDAKVSDKD